MKSRWLIIALIVVAIALPWCFYDWTHHRHAGFLISMLSQMGMMVILALSYNMLLGQAGLFSLCHATFFGIGGYAMIHFLNAAGDGTLPVPMEVMPLRAGVGDPVRLDGDETACDGVRDDHAGNRRTDGDLGADVPSFLRR
jgi:branched-chain amino acid transport system permease protein